MNVSLCGLLQRLDHVYRTAGYLDQKNGKQEEKDCFWCSKVEKIAHKPSLILLNQGTPEAMCRYYRCILLQIKDDRTLLGSRLLHDIKRHSERLLDTGAGSRLADLFLCSTLLDPLPTTLGSY